MKGRNKIFLCALCAFLCVFAIKIHPQNKQIDSLTAILKKEGQTRARVDALIELAQILTQNNPDTALIVGHQALALSETLNYKLGQAWTEFRIGQTIYLKRDYTTSMQYYNKALSDCDYISTSKKASDTLSVKKLRGYILNGIGIIYYAQADYRSALSCYKKGLNLLEELGDKKQMGKMLTNIAGVYYAQADAAKALEYFMMGLKISEEVGDKKQIGRILGGIANVHYTQADYPRALDYYFKGLKLVEATGDKPQIGRTLGNIANIYTEQGEFDKALMYHFKGLKISEDIGDKKQIGATLANIANIYRGRSETSKALEYYFKGLKLSKEVNDKQQFGRTLGNIALFYKDQADNPRVAPAKADSLQKLALEYYLKAMKISEEIGDENSLGFIHGNIGNLYYRLGKFRDAEIHIKDALSILQKTGAQGGQKNQQYLLSILYEKTNRPALALEHYKKYIALRDTIFSQENSKKLMRTEMDHEYEKKKAVADAEHKVQIENQKLVAAEKAKKQNIVIGSVIGGLILVLIFAGFVFRSLRITNKQKLIIEKKNMETEHQKKEIEEKQKEILDSIHYARRIQMAQIPSEKQVAYKLERMRK